VESREQERFLEETGPSDERSEPRGPGMPGPLGSSAAHSDPPGGSHGRRRRRHFTPEERTGYVEAYLAGDLSQTAFCAAHALSPGSLVQWLSRYEAAGSEGLADRRRRRSVPRERRPGRGRHHTAEEKRAIVEAYQGSPLTQADFAKTFGICKKTLALWLLAYREAGPRGLEPRTPGPKPGSQIAQPSSAIPPSVREEIIATKRSYPDFGLRKIRDFLLRFRGMKVSPGGIGGTLARAGIDPLVPIVKRRRKPDQVRRFERAQAMELWQTDITSFFLGRESRRVYLTVFIDDRSRYVVSHALMHRQTADLVIEALRDGISRFGKPKEVLSDQGRQYFAWRGKSEFQKLLHREGIQHVVARAHHPETVGKCERLWATIQKEFWSKVLPQSIDEARRRLALYLAHYNHFRPHQGIDGLVPADRFFGSEDAARQTIEKAIERQPLARALEEKARRPVFLFGQIGDRQLSLHGERGRVVIQTADGLREEIALEEALEEETDDGHEIGHDDGDGSGDDECGQDPRAHSQGPQIEEAPALQDAGEARSQHPRDLGEGESGGENRGASLGSGDPRNLGGTHDAPGRRS
jgi:transposase InsO family protein/transposase-like protein